MKTTDVAMIAGEAFGLPSSHVAEIIRRIRERDMYVRETRSKTNRPRATVRHLANLVAALLTGASSRSAADAVERVERCVANSHYFQKFFRTDEVRLGDDFSLFFNDRDWNKRRMPTGDRAPLHKFVDAARDDGRFYQFSIVDALEILIEALASYEEIFPLLACSEISYDPDRNSAELQLIASEWSVDAGDYFPREHGSEMFGATMVSFSLSFSDDDNDFRGLVSRSTTIDFRLLLRFAKALRRGDA